MKRRVALLSFMLIYGLGASLLLAATLDEIKQAISKGAKGKITLRVVDTKGNPVVEANVGVGFFNQNMKGDGEGVSGKTDSNGMFTATGEPTGDMSYGITKEGYYRTEGSYWFYRANDTNTVKDGRWQPWNPTNTVVLKEVRHPVPMFAKLVDMVFPVQNIPIGFDLEKGDWVTPYGKGIQPDIFFTYTAKPDTWELKMACSNGYDGFFRKQADKWSKFHSDYEASTNAYNPGVIQTIDETKKPTFDDHVGDGELLVFRMRSVVDGKGNLVDARYGKIYGEIDFGTGRLPYMRFKYYLNPDSTRNLEFDPKSNLFTNLPSLNRVNQP